MKKDFLNLRRSRWLLLSLFALFVGVSPAWADAKVLPYSYGFEDYNLATNGWTTQNPSGKNSSEFAIAGAAKKTGSYGFRFSSYSASGVNTQYLISPELPTDNAGITVSFAYAASSTSGTETFKVGYSTTDTDVASFTWGDEISYKSTTWTTYENTFPAGTKYIAVYYYANYQYRLFVDDFSFEAVELIDGPALKVFNGSSALATGDSFDFGLATAGTNQDFILRNPGTESISLNIAATNGFGVSPANVTIPAGGEDILKVAMADATASGVVTITPTAVGVDAFTINVSGTVRDPKKVYLDFSDGQMPDGWTSVKIGGYAGDWSVATGYAYVGGYGSSYESAFVSPSLIFENGETILFETTKNGSSDLTTPNIKVQYSLDGSTWTDICDFLTDDVYNTWTKRSVNIPVEGVKYIRFCGWYVKIRNIYGGQLPIEPKMVVTQPASLDYGIITEATPKTFTIANTGLATLEGISVTSSNAAFTITGAPTSLAAGASQDVTITMAATTEGALSSDITVSATDMENVVFTVSGAVLPDGAMVVDFNDNALPTGWTNASWTFANGEATGKSSSAYLTTPKLSFSDGQFIVVKAKRADDDATDYITVQGSSDGGETWTAYSKKINGSNGLTYPDYAALVISDIPTTVNKLRFVGFYCVVDEIAGLTYAPVLSVTKDAAAVTTPAAYDFGECGTNASVTYNFANTGAGTINITNVAITGDGAAAYSTNWSASVAAPFDLVITRAYDAERGGAAQDAVVTVTTSEGDFVINVTGIDKAANAPELAVDMASIDFGKLTANDTKTVTVTNNGTGSMDVTIASDDALFTVAPASLTGIGAGESKTFDVTFNFDGVAGSYGVKNANVTVTPSYDDAAAVAITATANAKDPNLWSEYFTTDGVPTGWDAGANWTIAEGVAKGAYEYNKTNYLTTPKLAVENSSDELTFDYQATANYVSIKIQMSKDGAAFADYQTISNLNNGDAGTYTITGLEAGDYQFRFANDDYKLDNFEGFKLNLPDHIMSITTSSIPESSSYSPTMKIGKSFDATVTVKELRGVAETGVVAKLYMDDAVIGTSTSTDFEANETKVITINCTPTVAAPSGAQMHIEVVYAGGTLRTETVNRTVADLVRLELDDDDNVDVVVGEYDVITLERNFAAGWNTFIAPLPVNTSEFGVGAKVYAFTGYADNDKVLSFSPLAGNSTYGATPYIVYVPAAIDSKTFTWEDASITSAFVGEENIRTTNNSVVFQGTYAPIAAGGLVGKYGVTADGRIAPASSAASLKGFRAYFSDVPAGARIALFGEDDVPTGIRFIDGGVERSAEGVYNLNGQRVQNVKKGLYIQNGRKVVIK